MQLRQKLFQFQEYLKYWLAQVDEHSLQPPFIFEFYTKVVQGGTQGSPFEQLEALRSEFARDGGTIAELNLGAPTSLNAEKASSISEITRHGITQQKYAQLLARLADYYKPETILELGTSIGIQTLYFAAASPNSAVFTMEGHPELSMVAEHNFRKLGMDKQISLIHGSIDHTLPVFLAESPNLDLIFLDANHTQEATLSYFYACLQKCSERSIIVIDDIHWSQGMQKAWQEIMRHPDVRLSVDLYQLGITFFDPRLEKQHWTLAF